MALQEMLTIDFTAAHPAEAAVELERRPPEEISAVFKAVPLKTAALLSEHMVPAAVARACELCGAQLAAKILSELAVASVVPILRPLSSTYCTAILDALPDKHSNAVRTALEFPPGSAGALMDPSLLAFPSDMTVEATLDTVKREAALIHYNLYVVDRNQVLLGALNLQELLLADPGDRLEKVMRQPVHSLDVGADRYSITRHPGWRQVYSLPVVDEDGRFVGAIRYRTLRQLELEFKGGQTSTEDLTIQALGDLFGAGMRGFVNALATGGALLAKEPDGSGRDDGVEE